MADHYTQFSEQIERLSEEAEAWCKDVLVLDPDLDNDRPELLKQLGLEDGQEDLDNWPDFDWQLEDGVLWLYSEDGGSTNHVALLVRALILKHMPDYIFGLTSAGYCSKPRVGEFGGCWMVVSKEGIESGSTWDAVDDRMGEIKKARIEDEDS